MTYSPFLFRHYRRWSLCNDMFRREHEAVQLNIHQLLPLTGYCSEESSEFANLSSHIRK